MNWLSTDIASSVAAGLGSLSLGLHGLRGLKTPKTQRKPVRYRTVVRHRKVFGVRANRRAVW